MRTPKVGDRVKLGPQYISLLGRRCRLVRENPDAVFTVMAIEPNKYRNIRRDGTRGPWHDATTYWLGGSGGGAKRRDLRRA